MRLYKEFLIPAEEDLLLCMNTKIGHRSLKVDDQQSQPTLGIRFLSLLDIINLIFLIMSISE